MLELFKAPIQVKEMRKEIATLQHSVDILLGQVTERNTRGNPYPEFKTAIDEVAKKYEGLATWGIQQVRNIIDVRAAFTIGQGIKLVQKDGSETKSREMEYIEEFVRVNDLDEEGPIDLAKEAEIEGRCLVKLFLNPDSKMVEYRFVSYQVNGYKIKTDAEDYKKFLSAVYRNSATQKDVSLATEDFVYKKFAGRIEKVNDIMPKVAMVLRQCEDLDRALADWREMNKYFASPTPYFECADLETAKKMNAAIKELNWKIGKAFAGVGKFLLVGMTDSGKDSLLNEITTNAKIISGDVGVPVHFLGFVDLMSNRSTSTDLFEFITASTAKERLVWAGFYEELFDKALKKANKNFAPGTIKAEILQVSDAKIQELATVWLPLYSGGVIDLDYMLSKIPDIQPGKVKKSLDAAQMKMVEDLKAQEKAAAAMDQNGQGGQGGQQ
jgi:hypothetical protein